MPALRTSLLRRGVKLSPAARALLLADLARLAARRIGNLDGQERARLAALLATWGRRRHLEPRERRELAKLVAKLEPRAFVGDAVKRLSPLPVPDRIAYGRHRR